MATRLWLEGFRIPGNVMNEAILNLIGQWKSQRKRSTHIVRAIQLYAFLLDNDIDGFLDLLSEFAPRLAFRLMQQAAPQSIAPVSAAGNQPKRSYAAPVIMASESEDPMGDLMSSLFG